MKTRILCVGILIAVSLAAVPQSETIASGLRVAAQQPAQAHTRSTSLSGASGVPIFGISTYFTNPVRTEAEVAMLVPMVQAIDAAVVEEQMGWDGWYNWGSSYYDPRVAAAAGAGSEILGILITTPREFRTPACQAWAERHSMPPYFCPPADPANFAAFAAELVERYDGDGYLDAPGSPRIAYWAVWDEPDQPSTWLPQPDPAAYAALLCATYNAIKGPGGADPTATVVVGALTGWQTVGYNGFMDGVVARGGWPCFDAVGLHPFILGYPPEEPGQAWSFPARLQLVQDWIEDHGGGKEAWATGFGWSTCGSGRDCVTEGDQASYLVRAYGLLFGHGFVHGNLFQLESMTGEGSPWRECAILRDDFTPKPAYAAYGVMTSLLGDAVYIGPGVLHAVSDTWDDRYDYRFRRPDGSLVDVLWQLLRQGNYSFLVEPGVGQVTLYDLYGNAQVLTPVSHHVSVTLSGQPQYLVRQATGAVEQVFLPLTFR